MSQDNVKYIENICVDGVVTKLYEAIGKAMVKIEGIPKSAPGRKGNQEFKFAPYHIIRKTLLKPLNEEGVTFIQPLHTVGEQAAITLIVSGHGAFITSTLTFDISKDPQDFGKISTYMRRYQLQAFFALEGDKDFDEGDEEDETVSSKNSVRNSVVDKDKTSSVPNKDDKQVQQTKSETKKEPDSEKKPSGVSPPKDVKSLNDALMGCMKQLDWKMDNLAEFCNENEEDIGGFQGIGKLNAEQKQKVLKLLQEKKGCAPF